MAVPFSIYGQTQPSGSGSDSGEVELPFPFEDSRNPFNEGGKKNSLFLNTPSNIETDVQYNPETGEYEFNQKMGDMDYRPPSSMDFNEYLNYTKEKTVVDYWEEKKEKEKEEESSEFRPQLQVDSKAFDRIFGGNTIDINPSGSAELRFGVRTSKTENPAIPVRQRSVTTFDFQQSIQVNLIGNIGDKVKVTTNYNTQATFNFENNIKLDYTGYEDEILQDIELGNVALPLSGSLITGSQTLFGVKAKMKFGKLDVTTVVSQQRGKKEEIRVEGGAQIQEFEVKADNYEDNRHYFLSHFFRDQYETAVGSPPMLNTGVNITRIEVWVTNTRNNTENVRNVIAFQDLGEGNFEDQENGRPRIFNKNYVQDLAPGNDLSGRTMDGSYEANNLYGKLTNLNGIRDFFNVTNLLSAQEGLDPRLDYSKVELARRLNENEYSLQPQLGYISLNQQLQPNQVLAVAFQYTYRGQVYQVGEFSTDGLEGDQPLIVKMLQSNQINTRTPMFDLMMKNVYNIGAFQIQRDGFELQVWYLDQETGMNINYIPAGAVNNKPLLMILGLDKLDPNQKPFADGYFDFVANPQITIDPQRGRIYFPLLEPFGSGLRSQFEDQEIADRYAFDSLYTRTQADAQNLFPGKNRFSIMGEYQSSNSSEIMLNSLNIPKGSVVVTAGGRQLTEGTDYTVDYTLGRVKIINQGILESGTPINVSLESNELFALQQKNLLASRFDYKVNDDLALGGTVMRLSERPLTQKVNIGNEPIANTIWGVDFNYKGESQYVTSLIDKIPLIDTKQKSTFTVSGEFAQLLPGHSRAIGRDGNSYVDDFEGSQAAIDLRTFVSWHLASTPQLQPDLIPAGTKLNQIDYGFNRAKLAWYVIDPLFFRNNNLTPDHIQNDPDLQSNHYMREVLEQEVFPEKDLPPGQPNNIPVLDLAFYPNQRGPYNYDTENLNPDGTLTNPEDNWGGIMRRIDQNDFEAANVEFIQFWVMDPFHPDNGIDEGQYPEGVTYNHEGGYLYFNLGNMSEDVLNDGLKSFENGLPTDEDVVQDLDQGNFSVWGRIPQGQQIINAFDSDVQTRPLQDVGLDGLRNQEERVFFGDYLAAVQSQLTAEAYAEFEADPSADDYNFYRDDDYDSQELTVLERYQQYNGLEGNSATNEQSQQLNDAGYPTSASTLPNVEDINQDNTLDNLENYYQYRVAITPQSLNPNNVGNNYITDVVEVSPRTQNGEQRPIRWYQFKIPVRTQDRQRIGNITDLRSVRFMRMFMTGFKQPVVMRFARLELIRGEWRRYLEDLDSSPEGFADDEIADFNIGAVNVEENSEKQPVNYVLPPGIERELNFNNTALQRINEQSLALNVCNLPDGEAVAAFRNLDLDMINYGRLQMYVHAESSDRDNPIQDGDLRLFVRIGADHDENYYEYEIPLYVTPEGRYSTVVESDREAVWPELNDINIDLRQLTKYKLQRNDLLQEGNRFYQSRQRTPFPYSDDAGITKGTVYVVGNPNLNDIKTIMIGVRNPYQEAGGLDDDGMPKCAEVWVNEMRMTDFDDNAGWAAIGRVSSRLADLATVNLSGNISTPGFGSIDKKVSERQRETIQQVDANANVELGKFFPEKAKVNIPMYVGYSRNRITPQFSPVEQDVTFEEAIENTQTDSAREQLRNSYQTITTRKSINFTNVRKGKTSKGKPTPIDISNFSATYAYSEELLTSFNIERDLKKTYRGGLSYNYAPQPKNYKPFSKISYLRKSEYYRLFRDFNFYLLPSQVSVRTDFNRTYNERQIRNNNPGILADLPPFFNKNFTWSRIYNVRWDLSRSLKFDFNANNQSLIDEPRGIVNKEVDPEGYENWRDSVWTNIKNLGTPLNYQHAMNLTYNMPINKIPILDWINSDIRYSSTYSWQRAPFAADSLGNTIQNSAQVSVNGRFNLTGLYNKIDYFKELAQKQRRVQRSRGRMQRAARRTKEEEEGEKVKRDKLSVVDHAALFLLTVKNISVTYSENRGTLLPGYRPTIFAAGMSPGFEAPGFGFITGQQTDFGENDTTFQAFAAQNNWLVKEENLNSYVSNTYTENLNINASLEPFKDFRVNLTASRNQAINKQEFFRWTDTLRFEDGSIDPSGGFVPESPITTGNFTTTVSSWRTSFISSTLEQSATYDQFLENRTTISQRLSEQNDSSNTIHQKDQGYREGYGQTQQDVLIPAFMAAYTGTPVGLQNLNPFATLPKVNWRITYNGLSKIEALKEYFKSININHSYRSTFQIGGYTTNQLFEGRDGYAVAKDMSGNYIPEFQINTVSIQESFSPLINFDMTWVNSLITKIEFSRTRRIALNTSNSQITEDRGREYTVGLGYNFKNVRLPFDVGPGKKLTSDLKTRADFSIRDNKTIIRKIIEQQNQETAGQWVFTIKISADYKVSNQLTVRLFYDRVANRPVLSRSFPNSNTNAGISLRFTLS